MTAAATLLARLAARAGFDLPKFVHALWMVLCAFLAMSLAWWLGLDHPQWAALTVFVTIQPSRGQTIEKNLYRFLGTLIGSGVGLVLLLLADDQVWLVAAGLAIWSGLCLFVGTLQRAYRTYGTVLVGYSAIIVVMNNAGPPEMVLWVAVDRVASIFVGVIAGIALGWLIAPAVNRKEYEQKTRRILADILAQASRNLGEAAAVRAEQPWTLVAAAAQLSSQLNALSSHRSAATALTGPLHDVLVCATNLLMASARAGAHPDLSARMSDLAATLHGQSSFDGIRRRLTQLLPLIDEPTLEEVVLALASSIPDEDGGDCGLALAPVDGANWQYDWRGATHAGLRIFIVTGVIGGLWALTGEGILQFALISGAIVISLASSGVTPVRAMRDVSVGQCIAALSAIGCEMLFWRQGLSGLGQVLAMLPSFLLYAFIRSHRRTSLSATDYALTLMLMLTPSHAIYVETWSPLLKGVMAVCGGLSGWIAFRWLFPINATRRRKMLWAMIKTELQAIAAASPSTRGSVAAWRLRFVGRFLRIVDWTFQETRGEPSSITMRKGLVTLALGDLVFALRKLLKRAALPADLRRVVEATLERISRSERETPELLRALRLLRLRLARVDLAGEDALARRALLGLCDEMLALIDELSRARQTRSAPQL